jgi:CheY-like chemotaxis protein
MVYKDLRVSWRNLHNSTILVVEDNKTGRYVLKQLLEKFDYDSHLVSSAEEALAAMDLAEYACVLMDIGLPGIDGYACTKQIRLIELKTGRKRTPVIALTGRTDQSDREAANAAGMDDFLSKPFSAEELRKVLLRHVYEAARSNLKVLPPPGKQNGAAQKAGPIRKFGNSI